MPSTLAGVVLFRQQGLEFSLHPAEAIPNLILGQVDFVGNLRRAASVDPAEMDDPVVLLRHAAAVTGKWD